MIDFGANVLIPFGRPGACIIKLFRDINNYVRYKASVFVIVIGFFIGFNKHTSFLHYRINYGHKNFYDTGPRALYHKNIFAVVISL
jgi:hypothetical protein